MMPAKSAWASKGVMLFSFGMNCRSSHTSSLELDAARRGGYARVRIDGNMYELDDCLLDTSRCV